MSRRREHGLSVGWMDAFGVARPPAIGTLPLRVGLSAVLPVLGHATWHLYREVVVR